MNEPEINPNGEIYFGVEYKYKKGEYMEYFHSERKKIEITAGHFMVKQDNFKEKKIN